MASEVSIAELRDRSSALARSLLEDPDRPFWQVEFISILNELAIILDYVSSNLSDSCCNLSKLEVRVSSLEHRYSELLYKMSGR